MERRRGEHEVINAAQLLIKQVRRNSRFVEDAQQVKGNVRTDVRLTIEGEAHVHARGNRRKRARLVYPFDKGHF